MNATGAAHCTGCGQELGITADATLSEGRCPECRSAMDLIDAGGRQLLECQRCGGQFLGHAHLRALLERRAELGRALLGRLTPANPLKQKVVYRPCPSCAALMNRRNFGAASGIIVDICGLHGTFFDAGELPRVLAFVARGGLERARLAEREAERKRRVTLHTPTPAFSDASIAEPDFPDLGTAVAALLGFIVDLVERVTERAKNRKPRR